MIKQFVLTIGILLVLTAIALAFYTGGHQPDFSDVFVEQKQPRRTLSTESFESGKLRAVGGASTTADASNIIGQKTPVEEPPLPDEEPFARDSILIDSTSDRAVMGFTHQRKIVRNSRGHYFVTYRRLVNDAHEIFVAEFFLENGRFVVRGNTSPVALLAREADQRVGSLAIDSRDVLHLVWYGADQGEKNGNRQIKYTRSDDHGASWQSWKNIAFVDGYASGNTWQEHPALLIGKNDTLYVAWEGKDSERPHQQIKFTKSEDGGDTWSAWKNVGVTQNNTQSRPSVVEDINGALHLFMYSSVGERDQKIRWAYSSDHGSTWSMWKRIDKSLFDARHISAVAGDDGVVHAVWREGIAEKGPSEIMHAVWKKGEWSEPNRIVRSDNFQFFPSIALQNGMPVVAWMEENIGTSFPKEKPQSGEIFIAREKLFGVWEYQHISASGAAMYPQLPSTIFEEFTPLVYSHGDDTIEVVVDFQIID